MESKTRAAAALPRHVRDLPPFRNEPLTDFTRPEARAAMRAALEEVRGQLGRSYPLAIGGREVATPESLRLDSTPGDFADGSSAASPGRASRARRDGRRRGRRAFAALVGRRRPRSAPTVLVRAAEIMRKRRFELAAWEVYECGKPWREADADVAEAIDFCEFYAREMIRLAEPRHRDVPGETNAIEHLARGVAVVIPPWNFPLAIPCGMTVAALVDGQHRRPEAERAIADDGPAPAPRSSARPGSPTASSRSCPASATSARRWSSTPTST